MKKEETSIRIGAMVIGFSVGVIIQYFFPALFIVSLVVIVLTVIVLTYFPIKYLRKKYARYYKIVEETAPFRSNN
ncbi:MAG: hypothetical protein HYW78_01675 [Parcubacteria group bacterium]|nr:hypothetical protein [Parcubacteria group bacterium]